jgi:hypothetical protein
MPTGGRCPVSEATSEWSGHFLDARDSGAFSFTPLLRVARERSVQRSLTLLSFRYFGRARELPGVKELFATAAKDQAEVESYKTVKVSMFDNAPPEYYGNTAEEGEKGRRLLEAERKAEQAGQ